MDFLTVIGLSLGGICVYYIMYSAGITALFLNKQAAILVYGGTFASILISYPWSFVKRLPSAVRLVFFPNRGEEPQTIIENLVRLSETAKRRGMDSMESEIPRLRDRFMMDGFRMVLDGLSPELVRENLEKEIAFARIRHQQMSNMFKTMGTLSPIFGLLGTLIGVVQILKNLTDPQTLGAAMAIAVTATFYGIFGTNFFFLPVAGKLSAYSDAEMLNKEVIIEGILAIQAGEVPALVSLKLQGFLSYHLRDSGRARR